MNTINFKPKQIKLDNWHWFCFHEKKAGKDLENGYSGDGLCDSSDELRDSGDGLRDSGDGERESVGSEEFDFGFSGKIDFLSEKPNETFSRVTNKGDRSSEINNQFPPNNNQNNNNNNNNNENGNENNVDNQYSTGLTSFINKSCPRLCKYFFFGQRSGRGRWPIEPHRRIIICLYFLSPSPVRLS